MGTQAKNADDKPKALEFLRIAKSLRSMVDDLQNGVDIGDCFALVISYDKDVHAPSSCKPSLCEVRKG